MNRILKTENEGTTIQEHVARSWYRKSHNNYEPSEQIVRDYERCFDKSIRFGKPRKVHGSAVRLKGLLTWINHEPITLVRCQQAGFIERTRSSIGQVKECEATRICADYVHGKKSIKEYDASDVLRDSNLDKKVLFWWRCLQDLSNFRRKLKKRVPEVPFLDIEDELFCLDKKCAGILPEDKVFTIIKKHRVCPNEEFFAPLMDALQIRKDGNINYRGLLNLFNWRHSFPVLPKMRQASMPSTDYVTTYGYSMGYIQKYDCEKICATGLPSEISRLPITTPCINISPSQKNVCDKISDHCSISPSIFTRYGLMHKDFFKPRGKEEMRSMFENVGFKFPGNSFDELWQDGLRKDCTGAVCIETFRQLLAASNLAAQKITYG